MSNPLRDFFLGTVQPKKELVEALVPRRTFDDVILPSSTRKALDQALVQIQKHDLLFGQWGLAERHNTGLGLAFNFAGPPGVGKTVCAEAIASALKKKLLVVRYSEMESLWAGETGKNVASVFRGAAEQDAVLFFDEADAIAGRRFASVTQGYQREANTVVNVLLKELESFDGVVIFATNMAANFDPAFERRIRTHILFEMPDAETRAKIWRVQLHRRTPLAADVDFDKLAQTFDNVSGGDIKNAVLKAAQIALTQPGADSEKRIAQANFEAGMRDVLASKKVMEQSIYAEGDGSHSSSESLAALTSMNGAYSQLANNQGDLEEGLGEVEVRLGNLENALVNVPALVQNLDDSSRNAQLELRDEIGGKIGELQNSLVEYSNNLKELQLNVRETLPTRLQLVETSREELTTQLQQLPSQIETKMRVANDIVREELRVEIKAQRDEFLQIAQGIKLSQTISIAAIVTAIIALVTAFVN